MYTTNFENCMASFFCAAVKPKISNASHAYFMGTNVCLNVKPKKSFMLYSIKTSNIFDSASVST